MSGVVTTNSGAVRGQWRDGVLSALGIPYATAPRFGAPEPRPPWDGIHDGGRFGTAAPQLPPAPGVPPAWQPSDGLDCLNLNVWTPSPGATGLPVMVWLHGGLWKHGATRMPQYDAARLASAGVVVVTVNYRLGFEGFGHVPGRPENRGLRDQLAALRWVRDNIAAFGGDPGAVTVFGQSAGAASTVLLSGSGLFQRAIAQSVPAGCLTVEEAAACTEMITEAAGAAVTELPPEAILAVQDAPLRSRPGMTAFGPVIDGDVVTGPPWHAVGKVDLVCGYTHEEFRGHGPVPAADVPTLAASVGLDPEAACAYDGSVVDLLSDVLVRMPTTWVAEAHAGAGGRTWVYDFAWRSPGMGAAHGVELPFVFGNPASRFAARFLGGTAAAEFEALSERVRAAWVGFAASGEPGWPRYDLDRRQTMVWDREPSVVDDPLRRSRPLWPMP